MPRIASPPELGACRFALRVCNGDQRSDRYQAQTGADDFDSGPKRILSRAVVATFLLVVARKQPRGCVSPFIRYLPFASLNANG